MSQKIVKSDVNNAISFENSSDIKEELQDENYPDNKVCVSETAVNINNTELNEFMRNDKLSKYETVSVDHIKTELPSSEVNDTESNTVKIEVGIYPADIHIKYSSGLPFCNHCQEVYEDYCTKCRMLVHILNKRPSTTYNRIKELPKYILETRESIKHLGIFSLKVIPEDVRFGPFTGLSSTRLSLGIKGGRFVVSDDKSEHLNWMCYINPARNIYEQNLFPFQYEEKLYYCSTRRIQEGEELLVYFGEEYIDNLFKNVEMDFVPAIRKDVENVFACTFCCLGFSSKEYLAEHKAVAHSETNDMFSVKELVQCPFCEIYLDAKEYLEHHSDYCRESSARHCVLRSPDVHKVEVESRSCVRNKAKRWQRGMYKYTQCKFRTIYNADFRHHTNKHYRMKTYKCGICDRRYKTKKSLKAHLEKIHADNEGRDAEKHSSCNYFKATVKNMKGTSSCSRQCKCSKCKFQARKKYRLKSRIKIRRTYKCGDCEFKTYYRTYLEKHMKMKHLLTVSYYKCTECEYQTKNKYYLKSHIKTKHLKQSDYKCAECEYQTNFKSNLERHVKTRHLKQKDYKCTECEFQANFKSYLQLHIRRKHLKKQDYKCAECEYQTNYKPYLLVHIKSKHMEHDYNCAECEFNTNYKSVLEKHIKTKHMKQKNYKCAECEYQANYKSNLKVHIKIKHMKQMDYKCAECELITNYKSVLETHIKTKHMSQKDYKCTECGYRTHYKSNLQVHVKTQHMKQKDYKCPECEFLTNYKPFLEKHIKTKHLKQKDYERSTECEDKTYFKSHLEGHMKTEHRSQKDYKCAECEYQANYKPYLQVHIKTKHLRQKDYKCAECEFNTAWKSSLKEHVKRKHVKQND